MAILAAPVAADPCPDLRFALAREELAARMFNEHESEPAALAWRDSIERTRLAADAVRDAYHETLQTACRMGGGAR